jgi:formimidoylglutamate deiminase
MEQHYFLHQALLPQGWTKNVRLSVDNGVISELETNEQPQGGDEQLNVVISGLPNLHSHAFQRAFAGLTEYKRHSTDTFWTWREAMFAAALYFTPNEQFAVCQYLYRELLESGYTSVAEFHYLHAQPRVEALEMCEATIEAAKLTGIALTLLPVLYCQGDVGGGELSAGQRSFYLERDRYAHLVLSLQQKYASDANVRIGLAPHSLRAVSPEDMQWLLELLKILPETTPVHIHAAEQIKEVEAHQEHLGSRPVEWLLDNAPVNKHWCLIHATHLTETETVQLAKSGATVSLCPTTEASLGDGFFPLARYLEYGGSFGIGSDSNVCVNPWEELRLLEGGARLRQQARNISATSEDSSAKTLLTKALACKHVMAHQVGQIEVGVRADLLIINDHHPMLAGLSPERLLDTLVFAHEPGMIQSVMAGGTWQVKHEQHILKGQTEARFTEIRSKLAKELATRPA